MIFALIVGITIIVLFISMSKKDGKCPTCGDELHDSGYESWKKFCKHCGYRNYGTDK